jgi:hypothetical protein
MVSCGNDCRSVEVEPRSPLGSGDTTTRLPPEQPSADCGRCQRCKVHAEWPLSPCHAAKPHGLSEKEQASGCRLPCRAQVWVQACGTLTHRVIRSEKIFGACDDQDRPDMPLGLAIDMKGTSLAAFPTLRDQGRVCLGSAALMQPAIREWQKEKAAIRATPDAPLARLGFLPAGLRRVILFCSFGSQRNVQAAAGLRTIPPEDPGTVETSTNGAGLGAALYGNDVQAAYGDRLISTTEPIGSDLDAQVTGRYIEVVNLDGGQSG